MNPERNDRGSLGEAIGHHVISYISLVAFSCATLGLIYVANIYQFVWLKWVAFAVAAFGFFFSKFALKQVLNMMAEYPSMKVGSAFWHVFLSYVRLLCFFPLIGPLLSRVLIKNTHENPFTAKNDDDPA